MKIGLHVAAAGDFMGIPARARAAGGDVVQFFAGSPRTWQAKTYSPQEGTDFQAATKAAELDASFIHMSYLVSYGSSNPDLRQKSITAYRQALKNGDQLGVVGVVTHLGSHKGEGFSTRVKSLGEGLLEAMEGSQCYAILENSAGAGDNMGNSLEELRDIIKATDNHPRVKVCIDTCHALTAGYELRTKAGLDKFLGDFDKLIGLDRLVVMHLNDSKFDISAHRDRHENIGDGFIGNDGFRVILNHPKLKDLPGVLEVPGLDGKGPDKANVDRLRKLQS